MFDVAFQGAHRAIVPPSQVCNRGDYSLSDYIVDRQIVKKKTRRKDEIQEATIAAGIALLQDVGLSVGLAPVKFEDAIARSGVARATAYRAWSSDSDRRPQARFQEAVALRLLDPDERVSAQEAMLLAVGPMLDQLESPSFQTLTPHERGEFLRELTRVACNASYYTYCNDPLLKLQLGFSAVVRMHAELNADDPMVRALNTASAVLVERFSPLFTGILAAFGMKVRDGLSLEQFTHATLAFLEGLWFRPSQVRNYSVTEEDDEGWSLFTHGVWSMIHYFLTDDPANGPHTDLSGLARPATVGS